MLTLCAIHEAAPRLTSCNYLGDGEAVRPIMDELANSSLLQDPTLQTAAFNLREHAQSDDCALWEARMRMRDVLRVMNCVQCNLCRLHGKVTALGIASALRVLLGSKGRGEDSYGLNRVEIAALIATAAKLAKACNIAERFSTLVDGEGSSTSLARLMFNRFDNDGNGDIDSSEFDALLSSIGVSLSAKERAGVLKALDIDGSGTISFDEFSKLWRDGFDIEALQTVSAAKSKTAT